MGKIVFCEDDRTTQKLIRVALRSAPYDVYIADNGMMGLDLIERERPDVIFTDVSMPEMDGLQLLDVLRGRSDLAHIPVVLMTGSSETSEMDQRAQDGVTVVIQKPFSIAGLRATAGGFMR
jgi:two-component system chemotaxis response regulator CheY